MSTVKDEQILQAAIKKLIGAFVFMLAFFLLVSYEIVRLYPKKISAGTLRGFSARAEYALRYQTLLVSWLIINVMMTIYRRITTRALNPLDEKTETKVHMIKNVLTNSFETVIISVFSQLIFVAFAEPLTVLKFIPLINILQLIGRVTFFVGYPMNRGFGYWCSSAPNVVLGCFNAFKLCEFVLGF